MLAPGRVDLASQTVNVADQVRRSLICEGGRRSQRLIQPVTVLLNEQCGQRGRFGAARYIALAAASAAFEVGACAFRASICAGPVAQQKAGVDLAQNASRTLCYDFAGNRTRRHQYKTSTLIK